jgi:hypothetical protein
MAPDRFEDRRRDRKRAAELLDDAIDDGDLDLSKLTRHLDSDDPERRASATWALAEAARDRPHRTSRAAEDLGELLEDDDEWVRRGASWALSRIATTSPSAARDGIGSLTGRLGDDDPLVRENATEAVAGIAEQYPSRARPAVPELTERLEDDDPLVQRYAAEALRHVVASGEIDPGDLDRPTVHHLSEFEALTQKDVSVFDAFQDQSSVEQVGEEGPAGGSSGGPTGPAVPQEAEDPRPPETVPDAPTVQVEYANVERVGGIGSGRTGIVHRARVRTEADDHVVVALKRLRRETFVDETAQFDETFDRVTAEWRRLDVHDYVVSLLGADRTPDPWLAVEYMDGGSLRDRIGRVGFGQALWTTVCVVRAVSHAHAQGVTHGGIRPSNVLFSRTLEGAWDVPKLTDWALERCFAEHATSRNWLDPTYAAPEQLLPDRFGRPDHAADVYQLGTLIYELFAGQPPFAGAPTEVAHEVVGEEPRAITEVASGLPDDLDRVLTRALAKHKPERYETVDDLRRELEVFAGEHAPDVLE